MNNLYSATSQELFRFYMEDREGVIRSNLIVPFAIERASQKLREYIMDSLALTIYLRTTRKSKIRLLKKLKMRILEIVQITRVGDRFL